MRSKKVLSLIEALEPVAAEHGFEVVDAETAGTTSSPILRIYIDTIEGGIDLDQITQAQREWLDAVVDEAEVFSGGYMLEVSSPGIDRPLRTRQHFEEFAGEQVKLWLDPASGRKKCSGTLMGMQGDDVMVEADGQQLAIPFDSVQKARIVGNVEF